jgi:hypothetical protein
MPENTNFTLDSATLGTLFKTVGVITAQGKENYNSTILGAYYDRAEETRGLYVVMPNGEIKYFDVEDVNIKSEGTDELIGFSLDETEYILRTLMEDDGEWISGYKMPIPELIIEKKIIGESLPAINKLTGFELPELPPFFEAFFVYKSETSDYLMSINYLTNYRNYVRSNARWVFEDMSQDYYEDLEVFEVDKERAKAFLYLYDRQKGYLKFSEVKTYLSTPSTSTIINND